jgi:integrase
LRAEIERIIEVTSNTEYKPIISLRCACGLRVREVRNLKVAAFDIDELVVHIKGAKGKKIESAYCMKNCKMICEISSRAKMAVTLFLFPTIKTSSRQHLCKKCFAKVYQKQKLISKQLFTVLGTNLHALTGERDRRAVYARTFEV